MARQDLKVVFASALTIRDPSLVSTLAIYYDKIYLPHPYDLDPDARPLMRWAMKHLDDLEYEQKQYVGWKERWRPLFDAGVLEVLPPAFGAADEEPQDLQERLLQELGYSVPFFGRSDVFKGRVALALHALFSKTADPELIMSRPGATDTRHLRSTLATSLIRYRLPEVGELTAQQLLRVRTETQGDKQAFMRYLDQLVDDVESRLASTQGDEREAALRTIERKIIPELEEHLLQHKLKAEQWLVKKLKFVAKGVGTALGLCLTPWDFRNYTDASELLLDGADAMVEDKVQRASHKHRAFQFVAAVDKAQS
jgi:hypothetical protein